jgi:hypothetical protein
MVTNEGGSAAANYELMHRDNLAPVRAAAEISAKDVLERDYTTSQSRCPPAERANLATIRRFPKTDCVCRLFATERRKKGLKSVLSVVESAGLCGFHRPMLYRLSYAHHRLTGRRDGLIANSLASFLLSCRRLPICDRSQVAWNCIIAFPALQFGRRMAPFRPVRPRQSAR